MNYTVGSVAALFSGNASTNKKVKVIKKEIKPPQVDFDETPVVKVAPKKDKKKLKKEERSNVVVINADGTGILNEDIEMSELQNDIEENNEEEEVSEADAAAKAEKDSRTLFVGNVPVTATKKRLVRFFSRYGSVESVRTRCLAPENPTIDRRTTAIKKLIHPKRTSMVAYVVYRTREIALKALELNGVKFEEHYLRVTELLKDDSGKNANAIFIGQLDFEAEDNDLWKAFECCGQISSVRVVRDKFGVGTGIGYVNFASPDSVELALEMEDVKIKKRICRIQRCQNQNNKRQRKEHSEQRQFSKTKSFARNFGSKREDKTVKKSVYHGKVIKKSDEKKLNRDMAKKLKSLGKTGEKKRDGGKKRK